MFFWDTWCVFGINQSFEQRKRPCDLQGLLKVICRYCKNGGRGNPSPTELRYNAIDKLNKTASPDIGKMNNKRNPVCS